MQDLSNIKILATLGPSSMEKLIIQNMDSAGVDLFRINLSHTKLEDFPKIVKKIQKWTKKQICIDTEGAQVRTGSIKNNKAVLENNSIIPLTSAEVVGDKFHLPLYPIAPTKILKIGDILYIDFQHAIIQVIKIEKKKVFARVLSGGEVKSNKGVHLSREIELPPFTQKDIRVFKLAKKFHLSYFSASFVSQKSDVRRLRNFFPYPIFIISKIENRAGLANLEEICQASNGILIDRGDLSREVPLQKIGLAQKHILEIAKQKKTPLYVATNLLESMLNAFEPTRAEVNDITSTLVSGSKGLVLAAETAIGKHPVETVRMISGIMKAVESDKRDEEKDFLKTIYDYNLIEPHGGILVQNFVDLKEEQIKKLPKIKIDEETLLDAFQIAEGTYSPIKGFMNYEELVSVLEDYKLPNSVVWTLPILFQLNKKDIDFGEKDTVVLEYSKDKSSIILMQISGIRKINLQKIAKMWFGTDDYRHPGVAKFVKKGNYIVSGQVFIARKSHFYFQAYALTPKQTREIFKNNGWQKIVGFHTRNVIHRGHEFIQKKALELVQADALFISPVIGPKKSTDFSPEAILKSYETMLKNDYYAPYPALLGAFNTYSRYSGPREAVFTALCRKNFGCSHFIIGRDHTGVGNYYPPDASHKIFEKIGDIGITPLMFDTVYFCKICQKLTDKCKHPDEKRLKISGTEIRRYLLKGSKVPEYLLRKEISKELIKMQKDSKIFVD